MKDISLHILDIAENSIRANASKMELTQNILPNGEIQFQLIDNGKGISPEMLRNITDPFTTSRTTRKVGMGLALLKQNCEISGGTLQISSELGLGTDLKFSFCTSHIDCLPMGDMPGVLSILITSNPDVEFIYKLMVGEKSFSIRTSEIKEQLDGLPLAIPEVVKFIKEYIAENYSSLVFG